MLYQPFLFLLVYFSITSCYAQVGSARQPKLDEMDIYETRVTNKDAYGIWKFESEIFVEDIFLLEPGHLVRYAYVEDEKKMVAIAYKNFTQVGDCYFYCEGNTYQYLATFMQGRFVHQFTNGSGKEYKKIKKSQLTKEEMAILNPFDNTIETLNVNPPVNYTFYACNSPDVPAKKYVMTKNDSLFMPVFNDESEHDYMWGRRQQSKPGEQDWCRLTGIEPDEYLETAFKNNSDDLSTAHGDFKGDGKVELARGFISQQGYGSPQNGGKADEYAVAFSGNLPCIKDLGCCELLLINEGDLNGDGGDELSIYQAPLNGRSYNMITYTFGGGEWKKINSFSIPIAFLEGTDWKLQDMVFKENGSVYYLEVDVNAETLKYNKIKIPVK
jgi:hypothetical protein